MFTELPWGSLKIAAVAMTVCDVVHGGAAALAGDLRRPIREQLHIAREYKRHRFVDAAVARR
jgi:hypothetical protein